MADVSGDAETQEEFAGTRLERYMLGDLNDGRRHRRIVISLPVRFMLAEGTENRGLLYDMSPGGLSITSEFQPPLDSRIVLYIDDIGRVEGHVSRHHPYGFAVHLATTQNRRDRIAERLTLHANRHRMRSDDLRTHERTEIDQQTRCNLADGTVIDCRVVDLSLTGAAIEISPAPEIGTEISIGRMFGKVVRRSETGVGIRFLDATHVASTIEGRMSKL